MSYVKASLTRTQIRISFKDEINTLVFPDVYGFKTLGEFLEIENFSGDKPIGHYFPIRDIRSFDVTCYEVAQ